MRKILMAGLAALTFAGSMAATTVPAMADPHGGHGSWHGGGDRHGDGGGWRGDRGDHDRGGWGLGAGLAGFALGAAIAGGGPYYGYDDGPYYGGYYGGYYDAGPYRCVAHRRVWDPYVGRWVLRPYYYAC